MKQTTSQWDFAGELFPEQAMRRVFSVGELTSDIRRLLEQRIGQVWVTGEITNCRAQSSGHVYFTLKDAVAQISCIAFRTDPLANRDDLQDGRRVIIKGEMTVYEPRGQYQLRVLAVELQGLGALQAAFEKLKQKLAAEGMFDPARKRPLPPYPQRMGLITSPTGAAIRDVLHVIRRRNPALQIIFVPSAVQGQGAAGEIAAALRLLNEWSALPGRELDVILLTRGGGSLEDLWAFNEETVARAIVKSNVPVVSAVGHEIDFTISDFAADCRAATPSAGAEILTEGVFSSCKWLAETGAQLRELVLRRVLAERRHLAQLGQRHKSGNPRRLLNQRLQWLDELQTALARLSSQRISHGRLLRKNLAARLERVRPDRWLAQRRDLVNLEQKRLREGLRRQLRHLRHRGDALRSRLQLLGPEQVLARGYSITQDARTGTILRAADQTRPGQKLRTRLASGEVESVVGES
jgi:exodeoxyribonuclease VII large subunit